MAKDLDLGEFGGTPQLDLSEFDQPAAAPASTARRAADTGLALGRGIIALPEAAVGVSNLMTGGRTGKAVERLGVRFKDAKQILTDAQSDQQKAADAAVQQADGFLPTVGAMVENPSTIVNAAAESAPSMLAGGALSQKLVNKGVSAITAGAAGEGIVSAGQAAEQVRQEGPTGFLTPKQAALAATSGAVTGVINRASGRLADKLGIGDVNTAMATGKLGGSTEKGVARRAAYGAVNEGVLQELPQSAQEQAMQNLALDKPVGEGVAQAAASGMLVGNLTGGAFGAVTPPSNKNGTLPGAAPNAQGGGNAPLNAGVKPPSIGSTEIESPGQSAPTVIGGQAAPTKGVLDVGLVGSEGAGNHPKTKAGFSQSDGLGEGPGELTSGGLDGGSVGVAQGDSPSLNTQNSTVKPPADKASAIGINRNEGPLSSAAATAVDTGADVVTQQQEVEKQKAEAADKEKTKPGADGKKPEPEAPAPVQPAPADPTAPITGPFTQAIHGAANVTPTPAPAVDPQGAAAPQGAGAQPDAPTAPGVGADQGPTGAGAVPAAVPEPVQTPAVTPVAPPPTQENTNATQQASPGESIDPETGEITQPGAQGAGGDGIQRPADALDPGADAKGTQRTLDQPAAPTAARAAPEGKPAAPAEPVDTSTPKSRWLKNVADANRLAGPTGVQIGGLVNGRINFLGDPGSSKQARALRATVDEAIKAGATPQEIVDAATKPANATAQPKPPAPTTPVDMGAHTAATSPHNDRPEPTQAQKEAGNYKKAHLVINGVGISVENPEGSTRSGTDADGKAWSNTMQWHYGYAKRTVGSDDEQQDVFVKPGTALDYTGPVFVVDQIDPKTGKHDEYKSMVGAKSPMEARKAYMGHYAKDWKGLKNVTAMTWDQWREWLQAPKGTAPAATGTAQSQSKTPVASQTPLDTQTPVPAIEKPPTLPDVTPPSQQPAPASETAGPVAEAPKTSASPTAQGQSTSSAQVPGATPSSSLQPSQPPVVADGTPDKPTKPASKPTGGRNLRAAAYEKNPLLTFLAQHGLFHDKDKPGSQKAEFSPDRQVMVMGYGPVFRKTGMKPDLLTQLAIEDGYLPPDADESQLVDLIRRAIGGEKIVPMYAQGAAETEMQKRMQAIDDLRELDDNEAADLDPDMFGPSNTSAEDAMRAMGFTEQEIHDATTQGPRAPQEGGQGRGEPDEAQAAAAPGGTQAGPGAPAEPTEPAEGLTAPTRAEILEQQAKAEAERQRQEQGGDAPLPGKKVTGDTPDMFNTQGSVFDQPAEPEPADEPDRNGLRAADRYARDLDSAAQELASQIFGDFNEADFDPAEVRPGLQAFAKDAGVPADELRQAVLKNLRASDMSKANLRKVEKALDPTKAPAEPTAPAPKPGEVDNFGEVLPPARRNMAAKLDEELSDSDIANRPLSEIWPLAENQAIEDTFAAAVAHAARAEVPSKPRVAYKLKRWVEKVKTVRQLAAMIVSGRFTREQFIAKAPATLKDWLSKVMLLEQIPRDQWNRVEAVEERPDSFGYKDSKQVRMPHLSIRIDGKSHWLTGDADIDGDVRGTLIGNMQGVRALLAAAEPEERMQFEIRQRRGGKVFINKKGDSEYRALMEFDTAEEARKAITQQYTDLVAAWEATKARDNITERDLRSAENRPRAGEDHRGGRDVTPEDFQSKFGFRGGEFGKWVRQGKGDKERQAILNNAYDALMDLAKIAGIPPRAISLNGTLGIAFGSRGSGWASAHFEPGNLVMNLTKTRGAGALAHEWFHALDNYFSRMRRGGAESEFTGDQNAYRNDNFITHRPEPMMVPKNVLGGRYLAPMTLGKLQAMHEARKDKTDAYNPDNWQRDPKTPEGVRPEVEARFAALVDRLNESPMTQRARKLDGVKSGEGYWSRTLERAARAFESYVIAKMHEEGYHNDFLVNVKKSDETGKAGDRYPYLMAGEVKPIAEAFDALFDTMETTEDDAGNVAIREPDAPYETDLFGQAVPAPIGRSAPARPARAGVRGNVQPATGVQDTPAPAGEYFASTLVGSEVSRELGASRITKPEHAAQATTYLYKSAVERLDGIVTDKNGKPLGIVGGFKGALSQASVYPATLVAEAVRIPDAAHIWFSHNHPSGNSQLSRADEALNQSLSDVFRGSGIEPMGLLAIGSGKFSFAGQRSADMIVGDTISDATSRISVPVIERTLGPSGVKGPTLSSPADAKQHAKSFYAKAKKPGLMLMDAQNTVIAWVPITDAMMGELRGTGGLNSIYRAISQANAGSAIIVHGGELGYQSIPKKFPQVTPSENIAAALKKVDVRPLDSIDVTQSRSVAENVGHVDKGPVFARSNRTGGVHMDDAEAIIAQVREALPTAPPIIALESIAQAPADLRKFIREAGAQDDFEAAYHNGKIFILPSNVGSTTRLQFLLAHHEIRHHGLASMLGPRKNAVLFAIHATNANVRAAAAEQIRRGYATSKVLATEEALADMPVAELVKLNGWDKIVAAVREWLRGAAMRLRRAGLGNIGDAIDAKEWTDKDVAALIARAEGVSRGGSARYASEGTVFGQDDAQDTRRGTEDQARAAGFTMKAYRGVSKASPFNDSGTTWLTTDRAVAEAYAEEVMGYEDPDVLTVMVKPDDLPRQDASRLTDEQREQMQADGFGNPQAIGIYDRSDDHPLGGSRRNVTVIHAPREAVWTVDDGAMARTGDQTSTPAFKKWFGKSKVVNPDGSPMVVYHGTASDVTTFGGSGIEQAMGGTSRAHFFTPNPDRADDFAAQAGDGYDEATKSRKNGENIMPVYLALKNPLIVTDLVEEVDDMFDMIAKAQSDGHDGVMFERTYDHSMYHSGEWDEQVPVYVAFKPTQIKSAIGNSGDFDPTNSDIRFARDGLTGVTDTLNTTTKSAGNTAAHYRSLGLQALGRRQIVELYGKLIPQLPAYSQLMAQMDADKNEAGAEADQIAQDWGKLKDDRPLAELMHDATLAQMDPAMPLMRGDDPLTYDRLRDQFVALSPEARKVYVQARDTYRTHHENVRKAIRERIERSELRGQRKAELLKQMDDEFYQAIKGVYFPLARFGDYVVVVRDGTGKAVSVNRAESINEAQALQIELRKAYPDMTVGKVLKSKEFNAGRDAVGRGFMQNLYEVLGKKDMDEDQRAELEDMLGQLYLSALPDLSWAKHGIHRKGTPGFSQDARRAFAQNTFHGARYLAKVRYSDLLENELTDAQKQIDGMAESDAFDSVKAQQVIDEMVKRHDAAMNPSGNAISTALTSLGFVFHLGLSPASAVVNLTQTALVAFPQMGAKWGFAKASTALLKASQQAAANKNDISAALSADEKQAYDEAVRSGVIDVTMAHDLAGISQGEDAKVSWKLRPVMRWASFLFHHAEKFNRQVTFVAAYRLAREAGSNPVQSYEQAVKATYDGHFDYSASNRPRLMQGNAARVLLLFKLYGQNMVYTLSRQAYLSMKGQNPYERAQARKALGGLLAMHAAAAGVLGLPMVSTLLAAASMLGGDDDEPWDAEVALRNMLADMLGDQAADVLARGLSRLTPWDISGRVGLDKLILPDIQEGLEGQDLANSAMAAALGPVAGIGISMLKGLHEISDGNWARGLEAMAPSLARGPLKALRYGTEGAIDKTGKPIVEDVGVFGIAGQALGFSPSEVRLATEAKSAVHQADERLSKRRATLMRHYAMAVIAGDVDGAADAREDIAAFNEKNPQRRINPLQMAKSVATRRKQIAQSQGGVYLPKNHRDAMQAGQFGMQ